VRRLLEDLGSLEPPPPDPDFIDRLEFQLRAETIALAPDTTYDDAPWRVPFGIAAAAFTVVAGVAGITVVRDMPESHVSAHLVAATNVRVTLPNGEEYDAEPGMVIPKGAVVEVFSGGLAEINGMRLAPGSKVVVTDDGVRPVDADDLPQVDDGELAAPGRDGSDGRTGGESSRRLDPSSAGQSEPGSGDDLTSGLSSGDEFGPLRQAERTAKSRGLDAVRRTSDDTTPPQTSVAGPGPSIDNDVTPAVPTAPPSTTVPETTSPLPEAEPAPSVPESVPPTTEAPVSGTPTTEAPATTSPPTTTPPATAPETTPPTTTPPATAPEPTPTTTPDPSVPAVPPSGTTTTTTPDVDPAGEDGGEVTPPGGTGKGEGGTAPDGNPGGYDSGGGSKTSPDDPTMGDEQAAAGADADSGTGDTADDSGAETADGSGAETADGSGAGTDETAAADPTAVG
jgi:hypothetical protein